MTVDNAWLRGVWASPERYDALLFRTYRVFLALALLLPWFAYSVPIGDARASIGPANLLLAALLGAVLMGVWRGRLPVPERRRLVALALGVGVLLVSLWGLTKQEPVINQQLLVTGSAGMATLLVTLALVRSEQRLREVLRWVIWLSTFIAVMTAVASLPFDWAARLAMSEGQAPIGIGENDLFFRRQAAVFIASDSVTVLFSLALSVLVVGLLRPGWSVVGGRRWLAIGMVAAHLFTVAIMQSLSSYITLAVLGAGLAVLVIGWLVPRRFAVPVRVVLALVFMGGATLVLVEIWGPTSGVAYYATIDEREEVFGITVDRVVFANMGARLEAGRRVVDILRSGPTALLLGGSNVEFSSADAHPHNGYLQLLLTGGLVLTLVYAAFLFAVFWWGRGRVRTPLHAALLLAVVAGLTQNLFYLGLYEKVLLLVMGLAVTASTGSAASRETPLPAPEHPRLVSPPQPDPLRAAETAAGRGAS